MIFFEALRIPEKAVKYLPESRERRARCSVFHTNARLSMRVWRGQRPNGRIFRFSPDFSRSSSSPQKRTSKLAPFPLAHSEFLISDSKSQTWGIRLINLLKGAKSGELFSQVQGEDAN